MLHDVYIEGLKNLTLPDILAIFIHTSKIYCFNIEGKYKNEFSIFNDPIGAKTVLSFTSFAVTFSFKIKLPQSRISGDRMEKSVSFLCKFDT